MTNNDLFELATHLEQQRAQAMMNPQSDTLANMLSDDLYYGHSGGYWDTKADFMRKFREGTYAYQTVTTMVEKAVQTGDDGLMIHGQVTLDVKLHGIQKSMQSIYLAVWRRENGIWRFLGHQTALKQNNLSK